MGAVLCTIGCLALFLASTHKMPPTQPQSRLSKRLQTLQCPWRTTDLESPLLSSYRIPKSRVTALACRTRVLVTSSLGPIDKHAGHNHDSAQNETHCHYFCGRQSDGPPITILPPAKCKTLKLYFFKKL